MSNVDGDGDDAALRLEDCALRDIGFKFEDRNYDAVVSAGAPPPAGQGRIILSNVTMSGSCHVMMLGTEVTATSAGAVRRRVGHFQHWHFILRRESSFHCSGLTRPAGGTGIVAATVHCLGGARTGQEKQS